jgi:Holliday junction resolvasome RuvABC endonuclease subunit
MAFAYFKNNELDHYGKIKFFGNDIYAKIVDTAHKSRVFFDRLEGLEYMVIEQPIYLNSPKTAANLAMSHGALVSAAVLGGIEHIASVSPMQWQNWAGNKRLTAAEKDTIRDANPGRSSSWYKTQERLFRKQRTIKFVNKKFDIKIDDDDVADAIAIGAWAIDNWGKVF